MVFWVWIQGGHMKITQKTLPTAGARVQYIYIEMVMPVKYKGILIIIFGIYTRCQ